MSKPTKSLPTLVGAALVVPFLTLAAWPVDVPEEEVRGHALASSVAAIPASLRACTHHCHTCLEDYTHNVEVGEENGTHQDEPYECVQMPCPVGCIDDEEDSDDLLATADVQEILEAAGAGDMTTLTQWVASNPRVTLNVDRAAVQVAGCNEQVVAHVPLTQSQMSVLTQ